MHTYVYTDTQRTLQLKKNSLWIHGYGSLKTSKNNTYMLSFLRGWYGVASVSKASQPHAIYLQVSEKLNTIPWQPPTAFSCKNEATHYWKVSKWNQLERGFLFGYVLGVFFKENIKLFLVTFELKHERNVSLLFSFPRGKKLHTHLSNSQVTCAHWCSMLISPSHTRCWATIIHSQLHRRLGMNRRYSDCRAWKLNKLSLYRITLSFS